MIKWTGFEWKKNKVTQKSKLNRNSKLDTIHTIETEMASDGLNDVRGWNKAVRNLAAYDSKLLYE